jgi:hypothetical protein
MMERNDYFNILHLVLRLRMHDAIPTLPHYVFMAWYFITHRTALLLPFINDKYKKRKTKNFFINSEFIAMFIPCCTIFAWMSLL